MTTELTLHTLQPFEYNCKHPVHGDRIHKTVWVKSAHTKESLAYAFSSCYWPFLQCLLTCVCVCVHIFSSSLPSKSRRICHYARKSVVQWEKMQKFLRTQVKVTVSQYSRGKRKATTKPAAEWRVRQKKEVEIHSFRFECLSTRQRLYYALLLSVFRTPRSACVYAGAVCSKKKASTKTTKKLRIKLWQQPPTSERQTKQMAKNLTAKLRMHTLRWC